jgi:hypothetical protein
MHRAWGALEVLGTIFFFAFFTHSCATAASERAPGQPAELLLARKRRQAAALARPGLVCLVPLGADIDKLGDASVRQKLEMIGWRSVNAKTQRTVVSLGEDLCIEPIYGTANTKIVACRT